MSGRAFLALLSATLLSLALNGCITRGQIKASLWLNNGLPSSLCEAQPELWDYGFYRKLNDGKFEFIPYCDPETAHWLSIYDQDLERILDETLPQPGK